MNTGVQSLPAVMSAGPSSGDYESLDVLVRRHRAALYRVAFRLTGNAADAEDLTQETVLEALKAFGRFRPGTRFDRWVFRIMTNTFVDTVRRRRRHPVASLDGPDLPPLPDTAASPDERAVITEQQAIIHQAIADLPVAFRLAVVLVDMEGLSYEEAGAVMRCPLGTVRSRLHRGRALLRRRLARYLENE